MLFVKNNEFFVFAMFSVIKCKLNYIVVLDIFLNTYALYYIVKRKKLYLSIK